mgnify:CR=1 FL=1
MDCKHERLRCTNNEFFCLLCGQRVPAPAPHDPGDQRQGQKENAPEGPKKPVKRKAKKEAK